MRAPKLKVLPTIGRSRLIARVDGVLGIFDDKHLQPKVGEECDVMISGVVYNKVDGVQDPDSVRFIFLRVVTSDMELVQHSGFECSGSMCRTLAHAQVDDKPLLLTPGRTGIWVAENVDKSRPAQVPRPGWAYILRSGIQNGICRIEGVTAVDQLEFRAKLLATQV